MSIRPGTWERVHTDAGWHLRLVGANGEPVMTSEVYEDRDSCDEALEIVRRSVPGVYGPDSFDVAEYLKDVDER